ncbi:MAG: hypothetical protein M1300_04495 [Epsilonproteobacteria bacterium]|nr:hypothetical protein [Campylobacterota bacterium]
MIFNDELNIFSEIDKNNKIFRKSLLEVHNYKCFYTGKNLSYEEMEVDHVFPSNLSRKDEIIQIMGVYPGFNSDSFANFVPTSKQFNIDKSDYFNRDECLSLLKTNIDYFAEMVLIHYQNKQRIITLQSKSKTGVLGFYSPKGGVGNTTFSIMLSKHFNFNFLTAGVQPWYAYDKAFSYQTVDTCLNGIAYGSSYDLHRHENDSNIIFLLRHADIFFMSLQVSLIDLYSIVNKIDALLDKRTFRKNMPKIHFIITNIDKLDEDDCAFEIQKVLMERYEYSESNFIMINKSHEFGFLASGKGTINDIKEEGLRNDFLKIVERVEKTMFNVYSTDTYLGSFQETEYIAR